MKSLEFNSIYNMDCIEGMKLLSDSSVDLIITDPPFGIDFKAWKANYNRKNSRVLEGYNEVLPDNYYEFTLNWMTQAHRLLKDSGSMYIFSGWNYLKDILNVIDELGFITVNHIIWKYQFGVVTRCKYVTSHYHCLYLCKNDRKRKFFPYARYGKNEKNINGGSAHYEDKEDVWNIKREYWSGDHKTPTKLPKELIEKILAYSSEKDDIVMDPFLGSGQVAIVSKMMGRQYVGFEIVPEYYNFAGKRINENLYRIKEDTLKQV
jgi:site-specific DNA-methyltransferase (adenine-specific)